MSEVSQKLLEAQATVEVMCSELARFRGAVVTLMAENPDVQWLPLLMRIHGAMVEAGRTSANVVDVLDVIAEAEAPFDLSSEICPECGLPYEDEEFGDGDSASGFSNEEPVSPSASVEALAQVLAGQIHESLQKGDDQFTVHFKLSH